MQTRIKIYLVAPLLFGVVFALSCAPINGWNDLELGFAGYNHMEVPTDISEVIESDPAMVDNSGLSVTPTDELHLTGMQPDIEIEQYRLTINGLVDNPVSLTYEEVLQYPTVTKVVLLICPGFFADNAEWTGVPVNDLLQEAHVDPVATAVIFSEVGGGYRKELSLEDIMANDNIFLAHIVNGETLPEKHGFPLRLVAKGKYGYDWVKWVENIEVT